MHLAGGDPDLGAHAKLAAIGKLGRGIAHQDRRIQPLEKTIGGAVILGDDAIGVVGRETFGHSLIINPWGEIIAEGGVDPEIVMAELDLDEVSKARRKIPSLTHDREFELLRMDD